MSDNEEWTCFVCYHELDHEEHSFRACECPFQICRFCWNNIKHHGNNLCPNCRRTYPDQPVEFIPMTAEELSKMKAEKRAREKAKKEMEAQSRRHLSGVRIPQRCVVHVSGITAKLATEEILKSHDFFGQFGKITKISINRRQAGLPAGVVAVYITFANKEDAARCLSSVDSSRFENRILSAQYGTTKYCSNFVLNKPCANPTCIYLHEVAEEEKVKEPTKSAIREHPAFQEARSSRTVPRSAQIIGVKYEEQQRKKNEAPALPATASWATVRQNALRAKVEKAAEAVKKQSEIVVKKPALVESAHEKTSPSRRKLLKRSQPAPKDGLATKEECKEDVQRAKSPKLEDSNKGVEQLKSKEDEKLHGQKKDIVMGQVESTQSTKGENNKPRGDKSISKKTLPGKEQSRGLESPAKSAVHGTAGDKSPSSIIRDSPKPHALASSARFLVDEGDIENCNTSSYLGGFSPFDDGIKAPLSTPKEADSSFKEDRTAELSTTELKTEQPRIPLSLGSSGQFSNTKRSQSRFEFARRDGKSTRPPESLGKDNFLPGPQVTNPLAFNQRFGQNKGLLKADLELLAGINPNTDLGYDSFTNNPLPNYQINEFRSTPSLYDQNLHNIPSSSYSLSESQRFFSNFVRSAQETAYKPLNTQKTEPLPYQDPAIMVAVQSNNQLHQPPGQSGLGQNKLLEHQYDPLNRWQYSSTSLPGYPDAAMTNASVDKKSYTQPRRLRIFEQMAPVDKENVAAVNNQAETKSSSPLLATDASIDGVKETNESPDIQEKELTEAEDIVQGETEKVKESKGSPETETLSIPDKVEAVAEEKEDLPEVLTIEPASKKSTEAEVVNENVKEEPESDFEVYQRNALVGLEALNLLRKTEIQTYEENEKRTAKPASAKRKLVGKNDAVKATQKNAKTKQKEAEKNLDFEKELDEMKMLSQQLFDYNKTFCQKILEIIPEKTKEAEKTKPKGKFTIEELERQLAKSRQEEKEVETLLWEVIRKSSAQPIY